jgi:hypothetical protein
MRRAAHEGLHKSAAKAFNSIQTTEAVLLANGILASPEQWQPHMRRFTASMIMTALYDTPAIRSLEDESVRRINDHVMRVSVSCLPGSHLVELLPWMKHIPSRYVTSLQNPLALTSDCAAPSRFAKWKRTAEEWFRRDLEMFENLFALVRAKMVSRGLNGVLANPKYKLTGLVCSVQAKGIDHPCFTATLIKNQSRSGLDEREMAWLASTM